MQAYRNCNRLNGGSRKRRRDGMALVTTMLILLMAIAVLMLGLVSSKGPGNSGVMSETNAGLSMANARGGSMTAFNNAESGVEMTLQWLNEQSAPPANTSSFTLTNTGAGATWTLDNTSVANHTKVAMATGCFTVVIYPSPTNSTGTIHAYMIEATGYSGTIGASGTMSTVIHAYVQQQNFGKYAYFIDQEQSNNWLVGGLTQFDGPVHSNNDGGSGAPTVSGEDNILWFDNAGTSKQVFLYSGSDAYSCSAPAVNWNDDSLGNATAPSTSANWYAIAAGGQSSIQYGQPYIPMPTSGSALTLQSAAALGTATAPSSTGVVVPSSGSATNAGIYIKGNVNNMTLSVSNNVNQIITVNQTDSSGNPLTSVITLNAQTNQTTLAVTSGATGHQTTTTTNYTGLTNGVIYCSGSIGARGNNPGQGLSGVIADNLVSGGVVTHYNKLTIATDKSPSDGQMVCVNGSLTYNTPAMGTGGTYNTSSSAFQLNAGMLGLASYNIWVQKYKANGTLNNNVEVDALTLATGILDVDAYNDTTYLGNYYGIGSYISGTSGYFGEMSLTGSLLAGLAEHHHYDSRLATSPPPYFDTTGNQYDIVSWQVVGASNVMS